jgi:hypothetical protein
VSEGGDRLTLSPEIEKLRSILRKMGAENEDEREQAQAEAKGTVLLVKAIAQCVRIENDLTEPDEEGIGRSLQAIVGRGLEAMAEENAAARKAVGSGPDA